MSQPIELLGVHIDPISRQQFLDAIIKAIDKGESEYIVTPYSEFVYKAQKDSEFKKVINNAYLSVADGVFIQWATKFLSLPLNAKNKLFRTVGATYQYVITGASIVLNPKYVREMVPDRISGSRMIYSISQIAAENGYKVAILGGYDFGNGNTGVLAAKKLEEMYPGLDIVEIYPGTREHEEQGEPVIRALRESKADILYCCYGPVREEKWLAKNLSKTGIAVGIGLGGSLDYVSGVKRSAPEWTHKLGVEWFIRPFYSEKLGSGMFKRLYRAWYRGFFLSSMLVLKEKINSHR